MFSRSRANTTVGRNDKAITLPATTSRKRSETFRSLSEDSTHKFSLNSQEFMLLSKTMMDLNMTVARMPSLNLHTEDMDMKQDGTESSTGNTANPLDRFSRVAKEANVYLKATREKIESLRTASNEMFGALKQTVEELHDTIDVLKANKHDLRQELDEANDRNEHIQKELDVIRKGLKDSSHWIISKEEVELTSKKLGDGGYGTVTVANFRGIQVAAKQIHGMILTSYNRGMFDREMNIASKVRHPNCVQFLGAVVEEEPIILMELMPTVLREILPKELNRLSQNQIPPICRDIARALTYLHSMKPQPVIHRDVSSANVLLEPIANSLLKAKISDYGSANFAPLVNTKAPGNAVYAAPEACSVKLQSTKMDVFSFGVLVVEIHLREFPDPNSRDQRVYQVELMYPQIASLIKKCLCEKPEDRLHMLEILEQLK